jgi:phage terminase large subunit
MKIQLTLKQDEFLSQLFDLDLLEKSGELKIRNDNQFTEFYSFGGFGSGKSYAVYMAVHWIMLNYPNCHGVYVRATYPELKDSVIKQFQDLFPSEEHQYIYKSTERCCVYNNGSLLDFRSFDVDTKILSNQYDFIAYSQLEEVKEELFLQSLGRNRRQDGGLPKNIILGEGNPASGWAKRYLKDKKRADVLLVESKTSDNAENLPTNYEKKLRETYPDYWVSRYVDGEWNSLDEMVYSEFREKEHLINPIPFENIKAFEVYQGFDYGWVNPSGLLWAYVDYDGVITIFDEWKDNKKTCPEIKKISDRYGKFPVIADYSIKAPDRDGRSVWMDLQDEGMDLIECNKQELQSITLINSLLKQKRLFITKNCTQLKEEIENYKWKKIKLGQEKNAEEKPIQVNNHLIDSMNYLISYIEGLRTDNPEEARYKKSLEYANIKARPKISIERYG